MSTIRQAVYTLAVMALALSVLAGCSAPPAPTPEPSPPMPTTVGSVESAPAAAEGVRTFVIDTDQSSASYIVDEEFLPDMLPKYGINVGRQDTVGVTPAVNGQLELNLDNLASALGENRFHADLSLLESDQALRDQWIRENGPQFGEYPDAVFVATAIESAPSSYTEGEEVSFRLLGDLTIREITQPATFEVTAKLDGATLSGFAIASLRMSDFDIEPPNFANTLTVQDEFTVRVDFVAQEQ
jgi:polyisoprenoid-binding protein YceI